MTIAENKNFVSVSLYETCLSLYMIMDLGKTLHMNDRNRNRRLSYVFRSLDVYDHIIAAFLVDKNHPAGKELHCVTKSGIIFILNERKFKEKRPCFVTALIARSNQVARLYEYCGMEAPEAVLRKCEKNVKRHFNNK